MKFLRLLIFALSLYWTSGHEVRNVCIVNATKSFSDYNNSEEEEIISSVLNCCVECATSFERKRKALAANQENNLPSWLQFHDGDNSLQKKRTNGNEEKMEPVL